MKWALAIVLALAAFLRFYHLDGMMPALHADELELYVSVDHIVHTGVDVDGTLQPFLYSRLGRNPPVYAIAGYASTAIVGNSPLGWRLPAALFGIATVWLIFLVTRTMTKRDETALLAALLAAIAPMLVHFSRIGWEPAAMLPFLLGTLVVLMRAIDNARMRNAPIAFASLLFAALLGAIAVYTYPAAWFYVMALVGTLAIANVALIRNSNNRAASIAALAVFAALASPGLWIMFTDPHTTGRLRGISTFHDGFTLATIGTFVENYVAHFAWPYLFVSGAPDPRYLSGMGELLWFMAPLAVVGLLYARAAVPDRAKLIVLAVWLATYPLGGALTNDRPPNPPRTLAGIPALVIVCAIGGQALIDFAPLFGVAAGRYRRVLAGVATVIVAFSIARFFTAYFSVYPRATAGAWESGNPAMFAYARSHVEATDRVCFSGFNYYHIGTFISYYWPRPTLPVLEDDHRPDCALPRTLLITTPPLRRDGYRVTQLFLADDGSTYGLAAVHPADAPAPVSARRSPTVRVR